MMAEVWNRGSLSAVVNLKTPVSQKGFLSPETMFAPDLSNASNRQKHDAFSMQEYICFYSKTNILQGKKHKCLFFLIICCLS